jgi:hypothetical protein
VDIKMMDFGPLISPVDRGTTPDEGSHPSSELPAQKKNKVTFEEVSDADSPSQSQDGGDDFSDDYVEDFPWSAGELMGRTKRTPFEEIQRAQKNAGEKAWGPFMNEEEWDLARWMMTSSISQTKMDEFFNLPMVRTGETLMSTGLD